MAAQVNFDIFNPTEDHLCIRESVAKFAREAIAPQAQEFDEREEFNEPLFRRLASELNLFGITVAEEHGGAGLDATAAVIIHEEMSKYDPGFTLSYLAHEVLFVNNVYHGASPYQIDRHISKTISGEWIAALAMTEPGAGTDVLGMSTTAVRKGDRFIVNGTKQFITNGSHADVFLVYAKPERTSKTITALIIEKTFKGVSVGKKEKKLGMRSSPTTEVIFDNVEVPVENLLGNEGDGLMHMMRNLEIERLTLGAQSIGIALRCVDEMARYAIAERKQFGQYLYKFGQIQRFLSESFAMTEAARALIYSTALLIKHDVRNSLGAASAKLIATTTAETVARNAIQVLGGYGYTRDYVAERMLRDAILLSIGGGTNEAMQKNIANDLRRKYGE